MTRLALIVGVNDYPAFPLAGCIPDALEMQELLSKNHDGSPNFDVSIMTSDKTAVTRASLRIAAERLFSKTDVEMSLFYFAGHGLRTDNSGSFIITQDYTTGDEGMMMTHIIELANASKSREAVVILDCCYAGSADQFLSFKTPMPLREGVSFLAACRNVETSAERNSRGVFTAHIGDALRGGAADVRGCVSVPAIYAYVNEVLGGWEQTPVFHSHMARVTPVRRAKAAISDEKLRLLEEYFPSVDYEFPLDPSFEPLADKPNPKHVEIFSKLQEMRGARLIEPRDTPHMYFAAMESKSCTLTPLGQFYWRAVRAKKI